MLIVILALALTACANKRQPATQDTAPASASVSSDAVVAEGHLKPVQAANLAFQAHGIVEAVDVKIGDKVSKGDVLARLSNASQAEAQLAAANLQKNFRRGKKETRGRRQRSRLLPQPCFNNG